MRNGLAARRALAAFAALALAACDFAPRYQRPDVAPPQRFKEAGVDWTAAAPADAQARGPWWHVFGDAQLDALEDQATAANQDLRAAFARYQQARAQALQARADFLPTIDAGASFTRQEQSQNKATYSRLSPKLYNDYLLNGDLSYEIDVWGRVRNAAAAARAQAEASAADFGSAVLSIQAEVASDYFSLRTYDAEIALLDDTTHAYERALELTRNRFKGGVVSEIDVDQAETQLENVRTQATDTRLKRAQTEHALAVLLGALPSDFSLADAPLAVTEVPALDAGLPSTLLQRRPDVASAERRVFAANAQIGVVRAAYFPTFSLSAMLGLDSGMAASLLEAPSRLWSFGPSAMLTVFDGGRREALNLQARAAYDETVADYRKSVLVAYQDVEDNLAAQLRLAQETRSQDAATTAAERALQQAQNRYKGGLVSYLDVVTAQNTALQAQIAQADLRARRLNATVLLTKALGGGWSERDLANVPALASADPGAPPP